MNPFFDINLFGKDGLVRSVVEIPKETNAKYEFNVKENFFELDRCLVSAMKYPVNYGFMPRTIAEDGDPLDCIIITNVSLQMGIVVEGRALGCLRILDSGVEDDKIVIVPKFNTRISKIADIEEEYLKIISDFFQNYKNLTKKKVEVINWELEDFAINKIKKSHEKYKEELIR